MKRQAAPPGRKAAVRMMQAAMLAMKAAGVKMHDASPNIRDAFASRKDAHLSLETEAIDGNDASQVIDTAAFFMADAVPTDAAASIARRAARLEIDGASLVRTDESRSFTDAANRV